MDVYISWVGQVGVDLLKCLSYEFIISDHHFISTYSMIKNVRIDCLLTTLDISRDVHIVLIILPIMLFGTAIIFLLLYSICDRLCEKGAYGAITKLEI